MMVISRTPLRMSFAGGGSDLPSYYREHEGAVVSTAIDKYVYVTVNKKFDDGIRVAYSKNEEVESVDQIEHRVVRATMKFLEITGGVELTTIADVPSRGTGLGSSSSFTVGLLHALNAYRGRHTSPETLGRDSCTIEMDLCNEPIGKQDQYAAAYGGFNYIVFRPDDTVLVSPIICQRSTLRNIQRDTLVFYTGITRTASAILQQQSDEVAKSRDKKRVLHRMVALATQMRDEIQNDNIAAVGEILHENWELKKSLADGVSNATIDEWYSAACAAGAMGGKLLGAGGGGFLMFFVSESRRDAVKAALRHLRPIDIGFEQLGSRIIFYHN